MPAPTDRIRHAIGLLIAALAPALALAQAPHWPSAADRERALKARPFPSIERLESQAVPRPPEAPPVRQGPPGSGTDVEAMARSAAALPQSLAAPMAEASPLRIFVTLAMPEASLRQLVDQASRAGAVLVLRGLKDQSMRQTLATVRDLIGDRPVGWLVDPQAFERFAVRQAPTFVLDLNEPGPAGAELACESGRPMPEAFVSVAGDVSLDYALEAILRRRPEAAARIDPLLKRLRGS